MPLRGRWLASGHGLVMLGYSEPSRPLFGRPRLVSTPIGRSRLRLFRFLFFYPGCLVIFLGRSGSVLRCAVFNSPVWKTVFMFTSRLDRGAPILIAQVGAGSGMDRTLRSEPVAWCSSRSGRGVTFSLPLLLGLAVCFGLPVACGGFLEGKVGSSDAQDASQGTNPDGTADGGSGREPGDPGSGPSASSGGDPGEGIEGDSGDEGTDKVSKSSGSDSGHDPSEPTKQFANVKIKSLDTRNVFVSGDTIYAGTTDGLAISSDGGLTWVLRTISDGLGSNIIKEVFAFGDSLFAATNDGLSISRDRGKSWVTKNVGLASQYVNGVFVAKLGIFAATSRGLSKSTDAAETWTSSTLTPGHNVVSEPVKVIEANGTVYVASRNDGIFISPDGGANWSRRTNTSGLRSDAIFDLAISNNTLYAATGAGLEISEDGGKSWRVGKSKRF